MTEKERFVSLCMGLRLRHFRIKAGESERSMAKRMGIARTAYRYRELGIRPVTLDILLRFQLALNLDIHDLWFPAEKVPCVHDDVIRATLERSRLQSYVPTIRDVLEATAEAFHVPLEGLTGGWHHKNLVKARAAAAFVVASRSGLALEDLARAIRRTPAGLKNNRKVARKRYGPAFWRKVEAIQQEVESL